MKLEEGIEYCEQIAQDCELGENPTILADEHWQIRDWLKELKQYKEKDINAPLTWIEDNLPLPFEELKQMVGKPVWVENNIDEPEDIKKYWAIYRRIDKIGKTEYILLNELFYDKAEYGKTWQAYKKEKNEDDR